MKIPAVFRRYGALLGIQVRVSASLAMQYRFDFLLKSVMAVFWLAVTLIPLVALFQQRPRLVGWSFPEALVVLGWFVLLKAILEGAVTPSLTSVVEGIRDGRFDFTLLKPADAQFLVSTARFEIWRTVDFLGSFAIFAYAFRAIGRWPGPAQIASAALLLAMSVFLLYSLWILVISASFWIVRVDNLSYLMASVFDAARWPVSVFPYALRMIFTVVFPLALMTTFPAMALLGRLDFSTTALAFCGGLAFAILARVVWQRAIASYTSASS